jgi:hypothetical protein
MSRIVIGIYDSNTPIDLIKPLSHSLHFSCLSYVMSLKLCIFLEVKASSCSFLFCCISYIF